MQETKKRAKLVNAKAIPGETLRMFRLQQHSPQNQRRPHDLRISRLRVPPKTTPGATAHEFSVLARIELGAV